VRRGPARNLFLVSDAGSHRDAGYHDCGETASVRDPLGLRRSHGRAASAIGKASMGPPSAERSAGVVASRWSSSTFWKSCYRNIIHVGGYFRMNLMDLAKSFRSSEKSADTA